MVSDTQDANLDILEGLYGKPGEVVDAKAPKRSKELIYWRKCKGCQIHTQELGWITLGPAMGPYTAQEYFDFQQSKHAEPLAQYGAYPAGKSSSSKYDVVTPERRFEPLIADFGLKGIREIPFDQMRAYNWHRIPQIVQYFPRLQEVTDYPCEYGCPPNKKFTSPELLSQHVRVWHNDVAQPQAVGKEISKAIEAVAGGNNSISPETIAAIVMAVREAMSTTTPKEA